MSNAGPNYPSTMANDAGIGTIAWTNPTNIGTSNDVYATAATTAQSTQRLNATNFGFSIPAKATVLGILVEAEGKSTLASDAITARIIKGGVVSAAGLAVNWGTSEIQNAYGGIGNLWGTTWLPSDINASTFGVSLRQEGNLTATISVDAVRITVHYEIRETIPPLGIAPGRSGLGFGF